MEAIESKKKVNLGAYNNSWFSPQASKTKQIIWYVVNILFFLNPLNPFSKLKVFLLRAFGASVGSGVTLKPNINIKYPWLLKIGHSTWVGEGVWIDNLAFIEIGNNVCVSQGAMLLTGNHNYHKSTFDLEVKQIVIEDGVWLCAKTIIGPGVICKTHSILSLGAIATKNLESYSIYSGNPAKFVKMREIF